MKRSSARPRRGPVESDTQTRPGGPNFPVVGIGASAGGLEAFMAFLPKWPEKSGAALVFVQHLPPSAESLTPQIVSRASNIPAGIARDGLRIQANQLYVSPPGFTVLVREGKFRLRRFTKPSDRQHPIDDFFQSLGEQCGSRAIAIVLSGMGSNGSGGARIVRECGGLCIAQAPGTARQSSMPRHLISTGLADFVLAPSAMPAVVRRYVAHPYVRDVAKRVGRTSEQSLLEILRVLRHHGYQDFSGYKKPTILRRIERRMGLQQRSSVAAYARSLRTNPDEVVALRDDLLIHVTGFFRDASNWERLKEIGLRQIVAEKPDGAELRAWVTACSSGEEAYSLGILLLEAAHEAGKRFDLKIFATDVAHRSIKAARNGIFPSSIEDEISPARLARFFHKTQEDYRAKAELRDILVFAPHNLLRDPPFSRMDVCTCRNLLIYLEPSEQQRVLGHLHYSLVEGGILFLGGSEATGTADHFYEAIDKRSRIFRRVGSHRAGSLAIAANTPRAYQPPGSIENSGAVTPLTHEIYRFVTQHFGPAVVAIDARDQVIFREGKVDAFLSRKETADSSIWDELRPDLRRGLRALLARHPRTNTTGRVTSSTIKVGPGRFVTVSIANLTNRSAPGGRVIAFSPKGLESRTEKPASENGLLRLELDETRQRLQRAINDAQYQTEEMKASHEEATSMNEELQSTNEELETSKEELQSLNEEMSTVNGELQAKMSELESTSNDLSSLLSSTSIGVIFLDPLLRIRRYTPAVHDLVELVPTDIGRQLANFALKYEDPDWEAVAGKVLEDGQPRSNEIRSSDDRIFVRWILPYRTSEAVTEGVVLTFIDITDRARAERSLREQAEQQRLMLESLHEYAIFLLTPTGRIASWSNAATSTLGYSREEALTLSLSDLLDEEAQEEESAEREMADAVQFGSAKREGWRRRKDGSRFWATSILSAVRDESGGVRGFVKVMHDETRRRLADEGLILAKQHAEEANEAKSQFLATVSHELRTPMGAILLWANLLSESPDDPSVVKEAISAITRAASEQQTLIEDLVDTARIAAGKLQLEVELTDLNAVARAAFGSIQQLANAQRLEFTADLDPAVGFVRVDPHRIRQVIVNLLSNSAKFTPAGGQVRLEVVRSGEKILITVRDSGKGFPAEFHTHLFTRFRQQHNPGGKAAGGLGIGLSIARDIVKLHGGVISGSSEGPGKGAAFRVELPAVPLQPSIEILQAEAAQPKDALIGLRVAVIEDALPTLRALTLVLQGAGAIVSSASTAEAGLELLKKTAVDLLLCDLGLPDRSGLELIADFRQHEAMQNLPPLTALALTAFAGEDTVTRALAQGFQRCLSKPITADSLVGALAKAAKSDSELGARRKSKKR